MNASVCPLAAAGLNPKAALSCMLLVCLLTWWAPAGAILHTTCVNNATDLGNELEKAGESGINNDGDNHINLAAGLYPINNSYFQYASAKTFTLDITGGYNADCSKQVTRNPIYTVLSGVGSSKLIMISNSMGDVSLRYLTFKGGKATSGGSALSMNTGGSTGQIIIDYDIFTANTGGNDVIEIGASSLLQVDSSLFYGNSSIDATISTSQLAKFFALNNTFVNNIQTNPAISAELIVGLKDSTSIADLSNNIFTIAQFPRVFVGNTGTVNLAYNQLATHGALAPGTIVNEVGPQYAFSDVKFAGSTDFHLQLTSPAIAAGTLTPPGYNQPGGAVPTLDVQGDPRTYGGAVDLGAYEMGDEIFKDGLGF